MYKKMICLILLLSLILCGCSTPADTEIQNTTQAAASSSKLDILQQLESMSDEELIRQMVSTDDLESWFVQSSFHPETPAGLTTLFKRSEEFYVLMCRPTGLRSLKEYGPLIIEEYIQNEGSHEAIQARYLGSLLEFYFPDLEGKVHAAL